MSRPTSRSGARLEPPRKSVELVDPGAHELSSEGEEEYFSDASEGRRPSSRPATPSSPIPKTRIEKVDDAPSHGEVPGTSAYEKRLGDAVPDEVEILSPGHESRRFSQSLDPGTTQEGSSIPRTVVEKVDPGTPSHGEIPGTLAYLQRQMDAAPDVIIKTPESMQHQKDATVDEPDDANPPSSSSTGAIPETVVTRVDTIPAHGEVPGTEAYEKRTQDAAPDVLERQDSTSGSPTPHRPMSDSPHSSNPGSDSNSHDNANNDMNDFGDDFDDFEEGAQAGNDDEFGDFDDGFRDPEAAETEDELAESPSIPTYQDTGIPAESFPLVDFDTLSSLKDLIAATRTHLDTMFPSSTDEQISAVPQSDPIPDSSPVFPTDRSQSLWKQLITPPPLQPPNWAQSRIRRLFLVSLGVPVDLDEILPPSKQKKLILPDISLQPSTRKSESDAALGSVARLKAQAANDSTGSVDSTQSGAKERLSRSRRPKGPPPPPEFDLVAVKRLCATTDEKLEGFTDEELQAHVKELKDLTEKTSELLEYWLKQRDGLRKEKEAFEGVIENLVRHARRVRK
ncbi:hypothetical protein HRR83_008805 [Exophiala dermatitidis]|uniref:Uncharacterized protein n=2 Tax=Exophiala dermatitidis TaxID=5970 RepID=H6BXC7_EXODN|nr:uncharacterized protein HMPREF1120_03499 [Exophiala dermatitidis NIH/UT8656]KAJ4503713.1 hypothetical protein HRR73_009018 [Exophiala dermatitidis]EHY55358.1 hypothetical protein HMPREF1120_03499 [Exophiala dermatitidis NIH/UT8656]KAJ4508333.1 hypothetical protein HRR74_007732 [Exophiala dermatitidis]KAJ4533449.1 hypothetical protein HRR77_008611 [Exophiala dermatitidis]KAJ4540252.1 hypothetical protein HRR76_003662 [Exophiala dermatitidis]